MSFDEEPEDPHRECAAEIHCLQAENASLKAGIDQLRKVPEVIHVGRQVELVAVLKRFMDFQISDYDRVATRAQDYCAIRRDARKVLQMYGLDPPTPCPICNQEDCNGVHGESL